jgi:hypothetical protein
MGIIIGTAAYMALLYLRVERASARFTCTISSATRSDAGGVLLTERGRLTPTGP